MVQHLLARMSEGAASLWVWQLRALAMLAVVLVAAALVRRAAPIVRHRMFALGLLAAVAMPPLAASLAVGLTFEVGAAAPATVASPSMPALEPVAATPLQAVAATPAPAAMAPRVDGGPLDWGMLILGVWIAGAALGSGRVLVSAIGARTLRRGAGEPPPELASLHRSLQREVGVRARLKITPRLSMPIVVGFVRPTILLPDDASRWDRVRLRAVILHELGHVAHGDTRWFPTVYMARALLWINPLAWVAARRFFRDAEFAADDAALVTGMTASEYATHLLALARIDVGRPPLCAAAALGRTEISTRIRRILADKAGLVALRRVVPVMLGALGGALAFALLRPVAEGPVSVPVNVPGPALDASSGPLPTPATSPLDDPGITVPIPENATRAVLREDSLLISFGGRNGMELPAEGGRPAPEALQNHLIVPVERLLKERGEPALPLVVHAEPGIRFDALVDVLYTAGRAGFHSYILADLGGRSRGLPLNPPQFSMDGPPLNAPRSLAVTWTSDGETLVLHSRSASATTRDLERRSYCTLPASSVEDLGALADRMCDANARRPTPVVFAPDATTTYAEIIATMATASRDCGGANIIEAGADGVTSDAPRCDVASFPR